MLNILEANFGSCLFCNPSLFQNFQTPIFNQSLLTVDQWQSSIKPRDQNPANERPENVASQVEQEQRRQDIELIEAKRQQRKLNFLITQVSFL